MTTVTNTPVVGVGINRVDGPQKVTGAARYPMDFQLPRQAYGALVQSTVPAGRITNIDTSAAESAPGVLMVMTHLNAPKLERGPMTALGASPPPPLQDDRILHYGQHIAFVVADTPEQASAAARLVVTQYESTEPLLDLMDRRAQTVENPWGFDHTRGDSAQAFSSADVTVEATYTTPDNTNNPLGLAATLASWSGNRLTVQDTTQWPSMARTNLASIFKIPETSVRILVPYVGGAFGIGLRVWPHVILTAAAARELRRPVKTVLTRPQMFTSVGHRPYGTQWVKLGATRSGDLVSVDHRSRSSLAMEDEDYEPFAAGTAFAYACPNVTTRDVQVRLNLPSPCSMRAPAEAQGNFALESALDELSYALNMDPLALRLRNHADEHPPSGLPWSSKALRECYEVGAERFGWAARTSEPRSMRDGNWLVGYGMASVSYPWYAVDCRAQATVTSDGSALIRSAATDIGTGTYTVMTQLSAQYLGLPLDRVRFDLGDSDMPAAPQAGGSGLTAALGNAVHDACRQLLKLFVDLAAKDTDSPLHKASIDDVEVTDGRIHLAGRQETGETYGDILARSGLSELTANGYSTPASPGDIGMALAGAFGAKFVEVRVDADLGLLRLARVVSVIDGGRILNEKTGRSQIIGGTVGGIGMAIFEDTVTDTPSGRIANGTFGDYLIPVNADIPDMDVVFVGEPDRASATGTKGIGEVGLVGIAAAVGNAVFHATGIRIRSLPITLDSLIR
ncbi:xanthine dehydrogenase family protein molybdopterin-binding subunit [Streptomyces sp. WAC 01325]|uniref:xanthine dehydrogenase family protein molybdopterin-binding subunit n=1 Tax=Streptomyces sp. WAC 01325 TaxID=2203202 RepID=UPI000F869634|nr:xanthine dehydrogenase family protein molybdopterin-binding subunit [Streptomyces sp. WAC 01325]RSM93726.1 xanthine dehydrogenase family protein molybdopterin-binding subunit [Streptomyces sp. WAC 01325]